MLINIVIGFLLNFYVGADGGGTMFYSMKPILDVVRL